MQMAIEIVETKNNNKAVVNMLRELLEIEREQVAAAWLAGNEDGWEMNTDWPEHGFLYYDKIYGSKQ